MRMVAAPGPRATIVNVAIGPLALATLVVATAAFDVEMVKRRAYPGSEMTTVCASGPTVNVAFASETFNGANKGVGEGAGRGPTGVGVGVDVGPGVGVRLGRLDGVALGPGNGAPPSRMIRRGGVGIRGGCTIGRCMRGRGLGLAVGPC